MKLIHFRPQRRFTTVDALTLVPAIALGVAWLVEARSVLHYLERFDRLVLRQLLHPLAAFLTPLTLALLALRLRWPWPSLRSCLRQAGAVACSVAAVCVILEVFNHFLDLTTRLYDSVQLHNSAASYMLPTGRLPGLTLFDSIAFSLGEAPGLAVAGAYLALWSAGLWRTESSWIDRVGRLVGWFWIILALAFIVLPPWSPY
jgi:hypothetical protein